MFRYLAIHWRPSSDSQTQAARRLAATLGAKAGWSPAFATEGLQVFVTGCSSGANEAYELPSQRGVVLGRLFRRREAENPPGRGTKITAADDRRIIDTEGRALVDHFWGRWIAFLPARSGEQHVLRDPTGTLPCYQWAVDGVTLTFSWLEDVLKLLHRPAPPVNWDAVMAMLVFRQLGGHETALEGVTQVLGGELTPLSSDVSPFKTLWNAADAVRAPLDPELGLATDLLRETTTRCVRSWMSCYDAILLRLSGGVDSAILLGSLFVTPPTARISCLNYHSRGADTDERIYARLAAGRAGCRLIERHRDRDFTLNEVCLPSRTPVPSNHLGRMGSDRMDREAADAMGAPVMFTGACGDQLFQEIRSTWPAAEYLQVRGLDPGFPGAVLDAARLGRVSFWRALRLAFRDRFATHDPSAGFGNSLTWMPQETLLSTRAQASRFLHPHLLAATDLPLAKLEQLGNLISPIEYYNPFSPESSPETVRPLVSQPLLELCLRLPTYVLTRGGHGRALARQAFSDRLPIEIAQRRSKGGTDDHATAVWQRSLPLARSVLLEGQLVRRGLLDRQRIESALAGRPSTNGTFVGEAHSCFAIEIWLNQVMASTATTR